MACSRAGRHLAVTMTLGYGHWFHYRSPRCRLVDREPGERVIWRWSWRMVFSWFLYLGQCFVCLEGWHWAIQIRNHSATPKRIQLMCNWICGGALTWFNSSTHKGAGKQRFESGLDETKSQMELVFVNAEINVMLHIQHWHTIALYNWYGEQGATFQALPLATWM